MKKNIKLSEKQSQLVVGKTVAFKSDILKRVTTALTQNTGGRAFQQTPTFTRGLWIRAIN